MKIIMAKTENEKNGTKAKTLVEHTEDLLRVLEKLKQFIDFDKIEKNFATNLKKIAVMHDLGKANIKFQQKLEDKTIKDIRHNFLSGAFLKYIFNKIGINEKYRHILYKAIILHHGSYEKYLEIPFSDVQRAIFNDIKNGIINNQEYSKGELEVFLKKELSGKISLSDGELLDYEFYDEYNESFKDDNDKKLYILFKGFLHTLDHIASAGIEEFNYCFNMSEEEIDNKIIDFVQNEKGIKFKGFKDFQNETRERKNENLLTIAFTGSGKTIADHRWSGKKKFYLVPTRVSAEAFYLDSLNIYKEEKNVGILHGDIGLYISRENIEDKTELSISENDNNLSRNFAKPYIIATIDQILLSVFKYPRYEKVFSTLFDSNVTVDEVHLLSPQMFLVLIYFADFANKNLNTRFHFMTATMPRIYEEKLEKLSNISFYKNNIKATETGREIKLDIKKDKDIESIIKKGLLEKKKILIVKNQIGGDNTKKEKEIYAIETYCEYEKIFEVKEEINLLHGRFKFADKKKKYSDILKQRGKLWISTQVVEVALDLDFDIIISDMAPLEALIQRMGRCNRKGKREFGEFYVVENSEDNVYSKELKKETYEVIDKNQGLLSLNRRAEMLNEYFERKKIVQYQEKEFIEADKRIKEIFGLKGEIASGDFILKYDPHMNLTDSKAEAEKLFRGEEISIKIVLDEDLEAIKDKKVKIQEVSIPINDWKFKMLRKNGGIQYEDDLWVLKKGFYKYSKEKGLEYKVFDNML